MFLKKQCVISVQKSTEELYESNLRNFKSEEFVGKITKDEFKVHRKWYFRKPRLIRHTPFMGVFVGKITETEIGCDITLTTRMSYHFLTIMTILLNTHILIPLLLWMISLFSGNPEYVFLQSALFSSIIMTVIIVAGYIAPLKGEELLVKNILLIK